VEEVIAAWRGKTRWVYSGYPSSNTGEAAAATAATAATAAAIIVQLNEIKKTVQREFNSHSDTQRPCCVSVFRAVRIPAVVIQLFSRVWILEP